MGRQPNASSPRAVFEPFEPRLMLTGAQGNVLQIDVHLYRDVGGAIGAEILDDTVAVGERFFVELVAGDIRDGAPAGLIALPVDVAWAPATFEAIDTPFNPADPASPLVTSKFPLYRGGTLDQAAGTIDELVGGSLPGAGLGEALGMGVTERFSLLHFRADAVTEGAALLTVQLGDSGISFADGNTVYVPQIESQTLTVVGANHAPVAQDDAIDVDHNGHYDGTLVATDADAGDTLTYAVATDPAHGALTAFDPATGAFTYEPQADYTGGDAFTFTAHDGWVDSNEATVTVTVGAAGLFEVKMGNGRPIVLRYNEADDTRVTVVFTGGGEATLRFAGTNVAVTSPAGVSEVTGDDVRVDRIELANTTAANTLILIASGGADGLATVGTLTSATPVGLISAGRVDFIDGGILMTGAAYAGVVAVHSMRNGADIIMPGQGAPAGIVIHAAELSDETRVELGSHLASLIAWRWTGGALIVPWANGVLITGSVPQAIRGDLGADLTFTGASAWGMALGSLRAAGKITRSQILAEAGYVGSVLCGQWDDGLLRTTCVRVLQTTGRWADPQIDGRFGADVETTDAGAASALSAAVIAGQIACTWTFAAPVGLIIAGSTAETWTLAAAAGVTGLRTLGRLAGNLSALYYTFIYAGGALSAAITATGANASDMSIVSLTAGVANDISLTAAGGIAVLSLAGSVDTDAQVDTVRAKWITQIVSRGDVDFDLIVTGAAPGGAGLLVAVILGDIRGGLWDVGGHIATLRATATGAAWRLVAAGHVGSLYAQTALAGAVRAQYLNSAITTGDFSAALDLTGHNAAGTSLGSLIAGLVVGDVLLKAAGLINLIRVWQWPTGRIEAGGVNTLMTVGNANPAVAVEGHFGADVLLTAPGAGTPLSTLGYAYIAGNLLSGLWDITGALGMLHVAGAVRGTAADPVTVRSTASMATIMAGTFERAHFLAGIAAGVTDHADSPDDFVDLAVSIGSVTVLGTGDQIARFVTVATFSAASFGRVSVLNPDIHTGSLGFYAHDSAEDDELRLMAYRDTATAETWVYSTSWTTPYPGPDDFWHVI